ncbi:MAG TPA: MarR family winged helix-turn-helix transcriptional regulator [Sandaracinaceae bacterium LLY-WYZ-13_1]|nr:MarR family winged helix-turn-helix transcriptional regulator [Sandaracinaceae bacterium LLY-WYZ-13_1]
MSVAVPIRPEAEDAREWGDLAPSERERSLDEAMELIHFAFRRVVEAPDRALAKRGMGRLHHRLLYVVGKNPGIDIGHTCELLGITKQATHGPLRDLLEADLVEVVRPAEDRRRKTLSLTAEGERFERHLAALQHEVFAEAFQRCGADAVEGWREVMDTLGAGRRLRL